MAMDRRNDKPGRRQRLDRAAAARIKAEVRRTLQAASGATPPAPAEKPAEADDVVMQAPRPAVNDQHPAAPAAEAWQDTPAPQAEVLAISAERLPALAAQPVKRGRAAPRSPVTGIELRRNWQALREVAVDTAALERNLIITAARAEPAHAAFDVLRTKMLQAMADRGWRRVAITSPTKGCGKSFTALNLAVALSRYHSQRTVLLDLDLRQPALSRRLGIAAPGAIGDMLRGQVSPKAHLARFGDNSLNIGQHVALGLNDRAENYAAELFLEPRTSEVLAQIEADYAPDVMLFDMPPALAHDDAIALKAQFDCVLMVVGGGVTTPKDLRESVQRLGEDMPILGMVLNKADGVDLTGYTY